MDILTDCSAYKLVHLARYLARCNLCSLGDAEMLVMTHYSMCQATSVVGDIWPFFIEHVRSLSFACNLRAYGLAVCESSVVNAACYRKMG
jgi:hypothetical protein